MQHWEGAGGEFFFLFWLLHYSISAFVTYRLQNHCMQLVIFGSRSATPIQMVLPIRSIHVSGLLFTAVQGILVIVILYRMQQNILVLKTLLVMKEVHAFWQSFWNSTQLKNLSP